MPRVRPRPRLGVRRHIQTDSSRYRARECATEVAGIAHQFARDGLRAPGDYLTDARTVRDATPGPGSTSRPAASNRSALPTRLRRSRVHCGSPHRSREREQALLPTALPQQPEIPTQRRPQTLSATCADANRLRHERAGMTPSRFRALCRFAGISTRSFRPGTPW